MFEFLKIGGKIITTASDSNTNMLDDFLNSIQHSCNVKKIKLPKNSFGDKSSNTDSLLLIINKI